MKILLFTLLLLASTPSLAADSGWYRDAGDYIAHRSVRMGVPAETATMILTDGKRFDANLGKRLSLLTWSEKGPATAWTFGIDAGMLASLQRYSRNGQFTFATNTFDGFFGAWVGKAVDGWLFLFRFAHLSAHLVDNSPNILTPVSYSQFWEEIMVGKTFPDPEAMSDWDLHIQGSVGLNHTSAPPNKQPRAAFGISYAHAILGPSLGLIGSADVLRAGVQGQKPSYTFFAGLGTLNRPGLKIRPFRAGIALFRGSDYRNQNYSQRQSWTTLQLATEF